MTLPRGVRVRGITHQWRGFSGMAPCGARWNFVVLAIPDHVPLPLGVATNDDVDCMACIAKEARR